MRELTSTGRTSWLCATPADRERVLDMEARIRPLRAAAFGLLALALLACAPWVGWWTLIPLGAAGIGFAFTGRGLATSARPEYRLAMAWLVSEFAIAASVALTGGPHSAAVAWLVLPVVTLPARFNVRGVLAGTAVAGVLILASSLGVDATQVAHHPQQVVFPLALLGSVALLSMALMRSDLAYRSASIIDPLTSMLNRNALAVRVEELRVQAEVVRQSIGVIVCDLDRFKAVNDEHGHAAGDAVLRDVAYTLRKRLRAFDLAYRLGGEEFLVLLPGADAEHAASVAEHLRRTVAGGDHGGLKVTMSFGVTASSRDAFDYEHTFALADRALYMAKSAGRDCVRVLDGAEAVPPAPAAAVSAAH